jgi:hypothetical protein
MPRRKKKDVDARIEDVGARRARGEPVADLAAKWDVTPRQIRLDNQEWLRHRKEERGTDRLQLEEVLVQYDEVLSAAWRDHELLGAGTTSLDPKAARARSELLRIALSAIDRKASLLGPATGAQGEEGGASGDTKLLAITDVDAFWRESKRLQAIQRREYMIIIEMLQRGEHVPKLRPLNPEEQEYADAAEREAAEREAEWRLQRASAEDPGEPGDGEEHRKGNHGSSG